MLQKGQIFTKTRAHNLESFISSTSAPSSISAISKKNHKQLKKSIKKILPLVSCEIVCKLLQTHTISPNTCGSSTQRVRLASPGAFDCLRFLSFSSTVQSVCFPLLSLSPLTQGFFTTTWIKNPLRSWLYAPCTRGGSHATCDCIKEGKWFFWVSFNLPLFPFKRQTTN